MRPWLIARLLLTTRIQNARPGAVGWLRGPAGSPASRPAAPHPRAAAGGAGDIGVAVVGLEVAHAHIHLIPIDNVSDMNFANSKLTLGQDEMNTIRDLIVNQ